MNDFLLVLTGGAISLVSSATVTWLQARHTRRGEVRTATRESTRQLTGLFIAERDSGQGAEPGPALAEAEMMAVAISDRRTRERVRAVIRLLREVRLPELRELSGVRTERARLLLCDHALEVLGAHFRGERLPALPQAIRKMLDVEDEALNIHTGGTPSSASSGSSGTGASAAGDTAGTKGAKGRDAATDESEEPATSAGTTGSGTATRSRRKTRTTVGEGGQSGGKKAGETVDETGFFTDPDDKDR